MVPLNFSRLGASIVSSQNDFASNMSRRDFLKRRQGNGGSPVPLLDSSRTHNNSTNSGAEVDLSSARKPQRDSTTIRIRGKEGKYAYQEGNFAHPLQSTKNEAARKNAYVTSPSNVNERERVQDVLFRYREEKIQKELEKLEMERFKAEYDK